MTLKHRHKKHLGQNFLADPRAREKIVAACALGPQDVVVEIGPGEGAITGLLAARAAHVLCVEKDKDLVPRLREKFAEAQVDIIQADFLTWDMGRLPAGAVVVGNIPYNISTPIIEKLIEHKKQIRAAYLTVQLEFGKRVAACPGSKEYGALSCFAQYHAAAEVLFNIKKTCFFPVPKVDSCFLKLDFTRPPAVRPQNEARFFQVVRTAFAQRRKTLVNALASYGKERVEVILVELGLSPLARAEELNLHNFVDISDRVG